MGDVIQLRRPPDALQDTAALYLRTGDPVALAATVAAWRARYQQQPVSNSYKFAETAPMPQTILLTSAKWSRHAATVICALKP